MKIVFDTNVFIAAALRGSFSENILNIAAETYAISLICSEEILNEVRKKLLTKFHWTTADAELFLTGVRGIAEMVESDKKLSVVKRDPDDNKILECAVAGNADLIVSADQDLIKLKKFRGIAIIHPKTLSYTFPKYFKKY